MKKLTWKHVLVLAAMIVVPGAMVTVGTYLAYKAYKDKQLTSGRENSK